MTKKQKNRKRLLLALLAFSMVLTGAFVGTLAKYVTSSTATDEASAASFGLNIPNTIALFSESYDNVESDSDGKNIIAPGTEGEYVFELTGSSEVAYKVSAAISVTYSEEWGDYAPLEFSLDGDDWMDMDDFKIALSNELETETLAPNTLYNNAQTIHWQWPFYVSDENDLKDTVIGLAAAEGPVPTVTVSIEATAVQVD